MKFKKIATKQRGTYTYYGTTEKVSIIPSKDGVTEMDIKILHSLDDHEVYTNIKNSRPSFAWWERAFNIGVEAVSLIGEVGMLAATFKNPKLASNLSEIATIVGNSTVKEIADNIVSIKSLLKSSPEEVFEKVKSVLTIGDELKIITTDGVEFSLSQTQLIAELRVAGLTDDAIESTIKFQHNISSTQVTEAIRYGNLVDICNGFESPQGLIYNVTVDENRIEHVLAHGVPDLTKPQHSVFNVANKDIIPLVDEVWSKRFEAGVTNFVQSNGNEVFNVPMGRIIGTNGQTSIRVVVEKGTRVIVTAFPN